MQGRLSKAAQQNAVIKPLPGVRGNAIVGGEYQADPVQIVTRVDLADMTTYRNLRENYRSASRTVVTVSDQFGENWLNVTIVKVMPSPPDQLTTGKVRMTCVWLLLPETDAPNGT
jgi:hypothetical protein